MKSNRAVWVLVLFTIFILGLPLFYFGIEKSVFISVDPDIVYITNALLYTKYAIISYADHPGTPTIMLLYLFFFPFRIYSKYFAHVNFIQWAFDNYALLTYFSRILMLCVYSLGIFIFLSAIQRLSKSFYLLILSWMLILTFVGSHLAIFIVPENLSLLLAAIWISFFLKFTKSPSYLLNMLLIFIAGFTLANKFTSLFLVIPSVFLPLFIDRVKFGKKIVMVIIVILTGGLSFYFGILPAIGRFGYIKYWVQALFFHSGGHGTGNLSVFDWVTYSQSFLSLVKGNWELTIYIIATLIIGGWLLAKNKLKVTNPVYFLMLTSLIGLLTFAKYPIIHYNFINIFLLLFCNVYFLTKLPPKFTNISLMAISIVFLFNVTGNLKESFNHLSKKSTESTASILSAWTPFWSSDVFREQLDAKGFKKP